MTTVAYRNGVLAADRQVTADGTRCGQTCKIARSPAGHLVGISGGMDVGAALLDWVKAGATGEPPTSTDKGARGIVVYPDGRVAEWEGSPRLVGTEAPFFVLGSGGDIALGAMAMGADARRAVEIASQFDVYSGGGVDTLRLGEPA